MTIPDSATLLGFFLKHETEQRDKTYLIQPLPDGTVVAYSWSEVGNQARRMATYFQSLGLPKGSRVALLGRNSAHWTIADLATSMAGMVSVPLFPMYSGISARYALGHHGNDLLVVGKPTQQFRR
ncbi:AMP-binding protein [Cupriavidus basilensis]|uniref:AMP-binding protein n=1 Tax=Cupriavidus basilensis TaxID=68895 RepID=A0ABT6B6X4_9BURK|nr:AMP-binding protein [Cupriavidus basilensis]MDF3839996.1 AMP-binding protein [Cupriavidus basilensis]